MPKLNDWRLLWLLIYSLLKNIHYSSTYLFASGYLFCHECIFQICMYKVLWPIGSWYFVLKKCNFYPPPVQEKSSMKSYYPTSFEGSSRLLLDSRFLRKTVSSDIAKQEVEASCHQNGARYEPRWQPWPYLWPGRIRTFSLLKQLLVKGGSTTVSKITKVLDK